MAEVNLNEGVTAAQAQRGLGQKLLDTQAASSADYLKRYSGAISGQEGMDAMYGRIGSELGLPALKKTATSTSQQLADLPQVLSSAARGTETNANQLARLTGMRTAQMAPIAQRAQENYLAAESEVGRRMGFTQADQAKQLMPFQTEQQLLQQRYGNEIGVFSEANNNELNAILNKVQLGVQISEAEKQRAHQLMMQKNEFENSKQLAQMGIDASKGGSPELMAIGEGTTIFDPSTGRPVYTAPKTYKAESGGGRGGYTPKLGGGSSGGGTSIQSLWG